MCNKLVPVWHCVQVHSKKDHPWLTLVYVNGVLFVFLQLMPCNPLLFPLLLSLAFVTPFQSMPKTPGHLKNIQGENKIPSFKLGLWTQNRRQTIINQGANSVGRGRPAGGLGEPENSWGTLQRRGLTSTWARISWADTAGGTPLILCNKYFWRAHAFPIQEEIS